MLQVVKKTGSEEQKRALALAVKESSERDFVEEARNDWKTLPIAKTLTQLAVEKQVIGDCLSIDNCLVFLFFV